MNYLGAMGGFRDVPIRVSAGSEGQIANLGDYHRLYDSTISNLDQFWLEVTTSRINWRKEPTVGLSGSFDEIAQNYTNNLSNKFLHHPTKALNESAASKTKEISDLLKKIYNIKE